MAPKPSLTHLFPSSALLTPPFYFFLFLSITYVTSTPLNAQWRRNNLNLNDTSSGQQKKGEVFSVLGIAGLGRPNEVEVHPRLEIRELEKDTKTW